MILFEGPDCVGKTTIAKALARRYKRPYVRMGLPPDWWQPIDYLMRVTTFSVYDRYHWSHYVYESVRNHPLVMTIDDCVGLDGGFWGKSNHGYVKVLMVAEDNAWFHDKHDEHFNPSQLVVVNTVYKSLAHHFDIIYDVSIGYPQVDEMAELIARTLADKNGKMTK